jgi:hypothetical protein
MLFLEEKTEHKIEKSGLTIRDFFGNFAEVINQKLLDKTKSITSFTEEAEPH